MRTSGEDMSIGNSKVREALIALLARSAGPILSGYTVAERIRHELAVLLCGRSSLTS
jgi:hypothetical protein